MLFRRSRTLRLIVFNLIVYGLATLLAVWAFQGYWTHLGIGLLWFGILWAAYNLTVALTGAVAHRISRLIGRPTVVAIVGLLPVLGYGGMALCGARAGSGLAWLIGGVACGFLFQIARGLNQVVSRDELNTRISTEFRATANSLTALGVRLSFAVLGPLMGWLIDGRGYPRAFASFGLLYLTALVVLALPLAVALGRDHLRPDSRLSAADRPAVGEHELDSGPRASVPD
jgi:MFS family permease